MTTISNHPRLKPRRRVLASWVARFVIGITIVLSLGLTIVAIFYGYPLLFLTVLLLLATVSPIILLTSLHPAIELREEGIQVSPLVWSDQFVAWDNLDHYAKHSLLPPDPPERAMIKTINPEQEGYMVVSKVGALAWHFRIVGLFSGQGTQPTFAFSSETHEDYEQLKHIVKSRLIEKED